MNIVEHCNDLQNWHQGIECHSGCNETHTLPPVDSCSEYDPNDYSNLEESKADGLSCSPIKVHVLICHGFIDCVYLAFLLLCCTAICLVYSSYISRCHAHPLSIHISSVIIPCFSTQMLFLCIRHQKGRG